MSPSPCRLPVKWRSREKWFSILENQPAHYQEVVKLHTWEIRHAKSLPTWAGRRQRSSNPAENIQRCHTMKAEPIPIPLSLPQDTPVATMPEYRPADSDSRDRVTERTGLWRSGGVGVCRTCGRGAMTTALSAMRRSWTLRTRSIVGSSSVASR